MPNFCEGDFVLYKKIENKIASIKKGDIVVAINPSNSKELIIKRIHKVHSSGYELRGDNRSESIDSRHFGIINKDKVIGIVKSFYSSKPNQL